MGMGVNKDKIENEDTLGEGASLDSAKSGPKGI